MPRKHYIALISISVLTQIALQSALRIIDSLAQALPPSQVFPALRTLIQTYFQSSEASNRRGAMLALGVSVEGCSEFMTPLMGQVWPVIEAGLQDPDASVRKATCVAVSCLCEWLEEACVEKHSVLVPVSFPPLLPHMKTCIDV